MTGATPAARPDRVESRGASTRVIARGDAHYPEALEDLADPPADWYVRGCWPLQGPAVAIVGSRAATPYGRSMARRLAFDLAGQGVLVVSGLARGIDAAAHAGACDAGGATLAVLPGGIDRVVPASHGVLAEAILGRGAWVSEQPPGTPAFRGRFLERNRLIAALAGATVVVEAARVSGALNTAGHARRLGRPVLAVPGNVDRETSRGCHALLRRGATLCESAEDVVRAIGATLETGSDAMSRVRGALGARPRDVESLARAAGVTPREATRLLLRLRLSGLAVARPGQRWIRGG
jgi:DNA processing protein